MATRPVSVAKIAPAKPQSSGQVVDKSEKFSALYINPACEHDWGKLSKELQTLEDEGKIIWKCRSCDEITNTYDWQTP